MTKTTAKTYKIGQTVKMTNAEIVDARIEGVDMLDTHVWMYRVSYAIKYAPIHQNRLLQPFWPHQIANATRKTAKKAVTASA